MKHLKYLSNVLRHKWLVMIECLQYGLVWRGLVHDISKFMPSEWGPYAEHLYGKDLLKDKDVFDVAWLFHHKRNKHHWQFWVLPKDDGTTKILEMPERYMMEMI